MHKDCQLEVAPFFQCCCQCLYRIVDHHKHTAENHEKGVCFKAKGWICAPPEVFGEEGGAISDWDEHSCGCELFTDKRKIKEGCFNCRYGCDSSPSYVYCGKFHKTQNFDYRCNHYEKSWERI